ncbi:MAG: hypothetical protein IJZ79_01590 [Bacilli bacterium]|nr:hypothetical protein [Bacilli bacterium]
MKSITREQLATISEDLSSRITQLASQLKNEHPNIKADYWVDVEVNDSNVFILADNGYDITESIEVDNISKEQILALL